MALEDRERGPGPCEREECGSKKLSVHDGRWVCSMGHVQSGEFIAGEDDGTFGTQGKRHIKVKNKDSRKAYKVYKGTKAYQLYLESYQFLLWRQCYDLIKNHQLPEELWHITRDLWVLRLSKQVSRLKQSDKSDIGSQNESSEIEGSKIDPSLQEADLESTSSTSAKSFPKLAETIALCYIAIHLLRLPVSLSDVYRWIGNESVTYIRAIRFIPREMRDKLPQEYRRALDTMTIITSDDLQAKVSDISIMYHTEFGLELPPFNYNLLLLKLIKTLALPLEIFTAVRRLNRLTKYEFKYPTSSSKDRLRAISQPEAQLISLLVVAVKLYFPFDESEIRRHATRSDEPVVQRLSWDRWNELHTNLNREVGELPKVGLTTFQFLETTDRDILNMDSDEEDRYMNSAQDMFPSDPVPSSDVFRTEIFDLFPLQQPDMSAAKAPADSATRRKDFQNFRLQQVQGSLQPRISISDEQASDLGLDIPRPGSQYKAYRHIEDVPKIGKLFVREAAEASCMSDKRLILAVSQTEAKLRGWLEARRRASVFGEEPEVSEGATNEGSESPHPPGEINERADDLGKHIDSDIDISNELRPMTVNDDIREDD